MLCFETVSRNKPVLPTASRHRTCHAAGCTTLRDSSDYDNTMGVWRKLLCCTVLALFLLSNLAEGKRRKNKVKKPTNETNLFNFLRIFVLRVIYGFASMIGAEEGISDFMGGILVPPGVEDADYRDYLDGEEEYDY